ncbi:MAG: ribosome biogenesis GTP-binding protein YihA/YsxC [Nitriliruptoraceae bacterium]
MDPLDLRFVLSASDVHELPRSPAEVAVGGRSNVGKSTVVNALAGRTKLARTSKTPGRTQLLNCFATPRGATLVDLPGYGYAKVSASERERWQQRTRRYLLEREALVATLLLIDGEVGPTALDREMLAWLRSADVEVVLVATKQDKVRPSRRQRRERELAEGCGVARSEVLWVAAERGIGMDRLRARVAHLLGETQDPAPR